MNLIIEYKHLRNIIEKSFEKNEKDTFKKYVNRKVNYNRTNLKISKYLQNIIKNEIKEIFENVNYVYIYYWSNNNNNNNNKDHNTKRKIIFYKNFKQEIFNSIESFFGNQNCYEIIGERFIKKNLKNLIESKKLNIDINKLNFNDSKIIKI